MPTFSVRTIAEDCLEKSGELSLLRDIFSVQDQPAPHLLKSALELIHQTRCRPKGPSGLHVVEVAEKTITLEWQDNADNETGFRIHFKGERSGFKDHEGSRTFQGANRKNGSLTNLFDGFDYRIHVTAFNKAGDSKKSNTAHATTPIILAHTQKITLERQAPPVGPILYTGAFPTLGIGRSGRVTQIEVSPGQAGNMQLRFIKRGHSSAQCTDDNAVVVLGEGAISTPQQMTEIYGIAEPRFATDQPIQFIACIGIDPPNTPAPLRVFIQINIIFNP